MFRRMLKCGLLLAALAGGPTGLQAAVAAAPAVTPNATDWQPFWAQAGVVGGDNSPADSEFAVGESRSQHTARTNRTFMRVTVAVLSAFVVLRLFLLWLISRNRKKHAQKLSEGEA